MSYSHHVHIIDSPVYVIDELAYSAEQLSVDGQAIVSMEAVHYKIQLFLAGGRPLMYISELLCEVFLNGAIYDKSFLFRGRLPVIVPVRLQVLLNICLLLVSAFAEQRVRGVDQIALANASELACAELLEVFELEAQGSLLHVVEHLGCLHAGLQNLYCLRWCDVLD